MLLNGTDSSQDKLFEEVMLEQLLWLENSNKKVKDIKDRIQILGNSEEWLEESTTQIMKKESPSSEKTKSTSDLNAIRESLRK